MRSLCWKKLVRVFGHTRGHFWTIAAAMFLINIFLLSYNVHFGLGNTRSDPARPVPNVEHHSANRHKTLKPEPIKSISSESGYRFARNVQAHCQHANRSFEQWTQFWITRVHVISKHASIYCPLEKVGTTFWRRFIYQLNHTATIRNPFEAPIYASLTQKFESLPNTTKTSQLGDYFKFTFVRDPYNRILSAYIDKLFAPNPLFWHRFGEPAIRQFRGNNPKQRRRLCNSDPTFTEFLQYAIWAGKTRKRMDPHFLLASEMCIVCSMNYTFIGRMEHFKEDSMEIFRRFGIMQAKDGQQPSLSNLAAKDAIEDSIDSPFRWKEDITKCMGWFEALLRIWRKLQMRGLIEMKHKLPVVREDAKSLSRKTMLKLAFIAHKASDRSILKEQKRNVLIEMYRDVPKRILDEFREVYRMDFRLFEYDEVPGYIFNLSVPYKPMNFTDFRN